MLIAQITDCHVVERGELLVDRVDTGAALRAALDHIVSMRPRPDVIVATGDLVNDGRAEQYDHLAEILRDHLADTAIPVYAVPGNHDDRAQLQRCFPAVQPADPDGPLDHVVDDHPVRLVGLDTTVPGEQGGRVTAAQMAWLETVLASGPDRPTLVYQHHPPFASGITWMDAAGLDDAMLEHAVLARHDNVLAVVCGHVHRPMSAPFGRTVASCWPSTGTQIALALGGTSYQYADEPAGVAIHRWHPDDGFVSHLSLVGPTATWLPPWAPA